jgi:hypothetical protein
MLIEWVELMISFGGLRMVDLFMASKFEILFTLNSLRDLKMWYKDKESKYMLMWEFSV